MEKSKTIKRMQLVIPAMILCLIGDYCIGIEPADSKKIGDIVSTGWTTISDIRIMISNIGGMIGTILYAIGAVAFMRWLANENKADESKWDSRFLKLFSLGLWAGIISFMYFHISFGGLIQHFNVMYDITGGNAEAAAEGLSRMFTVETVTFIVMFVLFDGLATIGWAGLVWRRVIDLPKIWILAAPLLTALIGQILGLIPMPFKGIGSGFETLGWLLMFVGGIGHIRRSGAEKE